MAKRSISDRAKDGKPPATKRKAKKKPAAKKPPAMTNGNGSGPTLTSIERAVRDELILVRKAEERPWREIADEAGVTQRRAQQIYKELIERGSPELLRQNPAEIVEWAIQQYLASNGMLLAAVKDASTVAEAVGAIKAKDKNTERLLALLQATNYLPRNLGSVRVLVETEVMVKTTMDLIGKLERGDLTPDEFRARYLQALGQHGGGTNGAQAPPELVVGTARSK